MNWVWCLGGMFCGCAVCFGAIWVARERICELEKEISKLKRYNRELEDELNKRK